MVSRPWDLMFSLETDENEASKNLKPKPTAGMP